MATTDSSAEINHPAEVDVLSLEYRLPLTQLVVKALRRNVLASRPDDTGVAGTWLSTQSEVSVSSVVTADPRCVCTFSPTARALESRVFSVELDENRVITALSHEATRSIAPVLELVTSVVGLATAFLGVTRGDTSLEREWAATFGEYAQMLSNLKGQLQSQLRWLSSGAISESEKIVTVGAAVEVLKREIAAIVDLRLGWISAHAGPVDDCTVTLGPRDVHRIAGDEPPSTIGGDLVPPGAQYRLAHDFGALVAIVESEPAGLFGDDRVPPPTFDSSSRILRRRGRMATLAVYRRSDRRHDWALAPTESRQITVVDDFSFLEALSVEGEWFKDRKLALGLNPDQSVKTYGATATSTLATAVTAVGAVATAAGDLYKAVAAKPSPQQQALDQVKARIDLRKTSDELEKLATGHAPAMDLTEMEILSRSIIR
jgi:hypothetical protein